MVTIRTGLSSRVMALCASVHKEEMSEPKMYLLFKVEDKLYHHQPINVPTARVQTFLIDHT
jgi:hypothetical protein